VGAAMPDVHGLGIPSDGGSDARTAAASTSGRRMLFDPASARRYSPSSTWCVGDFVPTFIFASTARRSWELGRGAGSLSLCAAPLGLC